MRPEYVYPRPLVSANVLPRLIRKSELTDDYIYRYRKFVEKPIGLNVLSDLDEVTHNWTPAEVKSGRRLIKFQISQTSPNDFSISFHKLAHSEYIHSLPIISCIFWEELNTHIVTSVDIVLLLEFLVQQSFTIEEKNRIRRNLQSLKTYTISRLNQKNRRFFQLLMKMEDPRPRNIEKDLKIFKWRDLFEALKKVLSKYTPFLGLTDQSQITQTESVQPNGLEFLPFERQKDLKRKLSMSGSIRAIKGSKKMANCETISNSIHENATNQRLDHLTPDSAETNPSPHSSSAHSTSPDTPVGQVLKNPQTKRDPGAALAHDPDWSHSQVLPGLAPTLTPSETPHLYSNQLLYPYNHTQYSNQPSWPPQYPLAPTSTAYPGPIHGIPLERQSMYQQLQSFSLPDLSTMRPALHQKSSVTLPPITSIFSSPPQAAVQLPNSVYPNYSGYYLGVKGSSGQTGPVPQAYGAPLVHPINRYNRQ